MKKIICSLFLTLAFFLGFSQPIDVNWGVENKFVKNQRNQNIIGETDEFLFTFNNRPRGLFRKASFSFLKFDKKDFKLKKSITVQLPKRAKGEQLYFNSARMIGEQIVFMYNKRVKNGEKDWTTTLIGQKVSADGKVDSKIIEFGRVKSFGGGFWLRNAGFIQTAINDSRDKLLTVSFLPREEKNSKEKLHLKVFNDKAEKDWGAEFELPYTDKNFILTKVMLDEKGNAYILGKKYMEVKKTKKNGKTKIKRKGGGIFSKNVNYEFVILYYDAKTKKFRDYKINLKDKHIQDIDLKVNDEESIVCGGFYYDKGFFSGAMQGTFFARVNRASGEIVGQSTKKFDDKFLNVIRDGKVYSWYWNEPGIMWNEFFRGKGVSRKGGLKDFRMSDFEIRKDGSAVIVAEGFRIVETKDREGNVKNRYYYYDDVVVINVEPDGKISWSARVPKKQISRDDGGYYSSYFMKVNGDDVYFVFNDRRSNNKRLDKGKKAAYLKYPKRASTTLVKIDRQGKMKRKKLFTNKDLDLSLVPKETRNYQNYQSGVSIMYGLDYKWFHFFTGGAKYRYGSIKM